MMSKMGIKQEDIPAKRVVIEQEDKNTIIENPQVTKVNMAGQDTFQIIGDISEEHKEEEIREADIKQIMEKTGKTREEAEKALEEADGDLAQAIIELSG